MGSTGLLCLILSVVACRGVAPDTDTIVNLRNMTYAKSDPLIVPESLNITVIFALIGVTDVLSSSQTVDFNGIVTLRWIVSTLRWDPRTNNNVVQISVDNDMIWIPLVAVVNDATMFTSMSSVGFATTLEFNGQLSWTVSGDFNTACKIDITRFPFDTQTCSILLGSLSENTKLIPSITEFTSDTSLSVQKEEWELVAYETSTFTYHESIYSGAAFTFTIKRKSSFYVITIITPLFILSVANLCTFKIPLESGEKLSFSVSIMLSYSFYFSLSYGILPKTSGSISILAVVLDVLFALAVITTAIEVAVQRLYFRDSAEEMPKWVRFLVCKTNTEVSPTESEHKEVSPTGCEAKEVSPTGCEPETSANTNPWKSLAVKLDTIAFYAVLFLEFMCYVVSFSVCLSGD